MNKVVSAGLAATLLLISAGANASAAELPEGSVKGLPEALTVMDEDGNAVPESGEYFFEVEDMVPFETYTKDIQIMNLREDKAYHIYFYAEPLSKSGDIDLEQNCTAVFTLDGEKIFQGKVTGEPAKGYEDMNKTPLDLGVYEPGKSRKLKASVTWDGDNAEGFVNYGKKLVDKDGTHIIEPESGSAYIEGETEFRWIFYAAVDEEYQPPKTGVFWGDNIYYFIIIGVMVLLIAGIGILIFRQKKKNAEENE